MPDQLLLSLPGQTSGQTGRRGTHQPWRRGAVDGRQVSLQPLVRGRRRGGVRVGVEEDVVHQADIDRVRAHHGAAGRLAGGREAARATEQAAVDASQYAAVGAAR